MIVFVYGVQESRQEYSSLGIEFYLNSLNPVTYLFLDDFLSVHNHYALVVSVNALTVQVVDIER